MKRLLSFLIISSFLTGLGWSMEVLEKIPHNPDKLPNTPLGEEFGSMPWIVRSGNTFETVYYMKDRDEGNAMWLEKLAVYAKDDNGSWFVWDQTQTFAPCANIVDGPMYILGTTIDLNHSRFDGYQTGERIQFYWYCRFRDALCTHEVEKEQHFEVIVGEPLPSYPGQYTVNLHAHSQYTDNIGEWGGTRHLILPMCESMDVDAFHLAEHGYDVSASEWSQMVQFAQDNSTATFLIVPGIEANVDDNQSNEFPDNFIHLISNCYLPTPAEIPLVENYSTDLWSLPEVLEMIEEESSYWLAAHPFDRQFVPKSEGETTSQWSEQNIQLALADPNFVGFQVWNKMISSTVENVDENDINPYPWVYDATFQNNLLLDIRQLDTLQQEHLFPVKRTTPLAGTDDHGDYPYMLRLDTDGSIVVDNNALGKCFTTVEMSTLSQGALSQSLRQGKCYTSNGPACQFGVDAGSNGVIDVSFGGIYDSTQGGDLLFRATSNEEFGPFTRATLYLLTQSERDSLVYPLSGLEIAISEPLSGLIGLEPTAVKVQLETAGGYGDYPGLVVTGYIYFNTQEDDIVAVDSPDPSPSVSIEPNPGNSSFSISWTGTSSPQKVAIYDLRGQLIQELAPPLAGHLTWSGTDKQGQILPSGIYFVLVSFPKQDIITKLALVK